MLLAIAVTCLLFGVLPAAFDIENETFEKVSDLILDVGLVIMNVYMGIAVVSSWQMVATSNMPSALAYILSVLFLLMLTLTVRLIIVTIKSFMK